MFDHLEFEALSKILVVVDRSESEDGIRTF